MRYDPEPAARIIYAAVRQLRVEQGDAAGPVWKLLLQVERDRFVLAVRRANYGMTPERIHEAWREDMEREGWKEGPEIDHCGRKHPDLAGWEDLSDNCREFVRLLHGIAVSMGVSSTLGSLSPVTTL